MAPNAPHNSKKLVGTHWTAVNAEYRRKHWEVVELGAGGQEVTLLAVLDGHREQIPWRALRDRQHWVPGWIRESEEGEIRKILSFNQPSSVQEWKIVDDVVMGGRSQSKLRWFIEGPQSGALRFEGEVSLENNGGFCSTRTHGEWDLGDARELIWTLRGTDREFLATLRDAHTPEGASFRAPVSLDTDDWTNVTLALDAFRLFRRGQPLSDDARVDPSQIRAFGFLLADKRAGAFHLDVAALRVRSNA